MEEIKKEEKPKEEKVVPLLDRVANLEKIAKTGKVKELRLPRKARVRKTKLKKGWMGVVKCDENGNMSGTKVRIEGSAFSLGKSLDNINYHATDGREIVWWNGRFPVLFQETKKINPKNFKWNEGDNETYGDEYTLAKSLKDAITLKKKMGSGLVIFLVIGVALFVLGKFVFKLF